jgi:hypothetical protein
MMKQKYHIGDLQFKTKKECENYTRKIIYDLGCCIINKTHPHFNFFDNLLQNHPECDDKIGIGIDYFYIQPNPLVKKYYQTMITRLDGSEIDFSWVYCCQFKERTTTDYLLMSMREAIKNDTIQYKLQQRKLICAFCKTENERYENYHVDHHNPSFKTLKDDFLRLTKKQIPSSFEDCKIYKLTIFKDEDEDFKKSWVNYHNTYCNFQILCRDCNLRKKKT